MSRNHHLTAIFSSLHQHFGHHRCGLCLVGTKLTLMIVFQAVGSDNNHSHDAKCPYTALAAFTIASDWHCKDEGLLPLIPHVPQSHTGLVRRQPCQQ